MPNRSDAEEHLRIIRSLMEKATIYRAISAPTALVGGLASITAALILSAVLSPVGSIFPQPRLLFLVSWLAVLAITALANTWFLFCGARRRGEKFFSAGMRAALLALSPSFLAAAFFTAFFAKSPQLLPPSWMLFYGLSLLATQHFAPRSIMILGWSFLLIGMGSIYSLFTWNWLPDLALGSNLLMGLTFGLFHLIYAACTWPRSGVSARP